MIHQVKKDTLEIRKKKVSIERKEEVKREIHFSIFYYLN